MSDAHVPWRSIRPLSEEDVNWGVERALALTKLGLGIAEAAELAARECDQRIAERERVFAVALSVVRQAHHEDRARQEAADRAKYRAELDAKAEQAMPARPGTLHASLGDLLKFKRR